MSQQTDLQIYRAEAKVIIRFLKEELGRIQLRVEKQGTLIIGLQNQLRKVQADIEALQSSQPKITQVQLPDAIGQMIPGGTFSMMTPPRIDSLAALFGQPLGTLGKEKEKSEVVSWADITAPAGSGPRFDPSNVGTFGSKPTPEFKPKKFCQKHPGYRANFKPLSDCSECNSMWKAAQEDPTSEVNTGFARQGTLKGTFFVCPDHPDEKFETTPAALTCSTCFRIWQVVSGECE